MAKHNKQSEELTGIDNLNESLTSFGTRMEKNKGLIGWIVLGVVVVAVAVFGFIFFNNRSNSDSARKYSGLEVKIEEQVQKAQPAAQDSLRNALWVKELKALAESEKGKAGGNLANLNLAGRYYQDGKYKEALACIEGAKIDEPIMKGQILVLKGDCYVGLKQYPQAIEAYDAAVAASDKTPDTAVRALAKKALVLDAQKKYADAKAVYELMLKDYPMEASTQGINPEAYIARENARLGK